MTLTSIYGTVYNNAKYIDSCLTSLINALPNFDDKYELVVVDNYSTDGTFEKLLKFSEKHKNVKLFRVKCTRGKGRDIALKNTSGDLVFYIDFDNIFEKEFGMLVEKLENLCTKGTLWQFGFSTRDTSIDKIGGWRDLNYGEDWEFVARAISKGVTVKGILSPSFLIGPKMKMREGRYSKGFLYVIRRFRNIVDSIRGCNPSFHFLLKECAILFRPSILMSLILCPILKMASFKYSKGLSSNIELVYQKMQFVFPEDIGLPSDWLFIKWEHAQCMWNTIKKRIRELTIRDKSLKFMLLENNILICARNPHIAIKYA